MSLETDENLAHQHALTSRKCARRLAWIVQESMACDDEVERMPRVAREVRRLLDNLERVVSYLEKHRGAWTAPAPETSEPVQ
jgi:hypothetical protein